MNPDSPTPAPEQAPTPQPPTSTPQPNPGGQPPKKSNKALILAVVGGVLFLLLIGVGIAIASNMLSKNSTDTKRDDESSKVDTTTDTEEETPNPEAHSITAKALVELRAACVGGSVENAGALTKPYTYVVYENNNSQSAEKEDWKWDMYAVGASDDSIPLDFSSAPSELNVVVCLDRDESTAVKSSTCELERSAGMKSTDSTVADFYSVKYKVKLYEARSGKKMKELAPINGPATECPPLAYYNTEGDPAVYGDPDIDELNARLKAFEK